MTSEDSYQIGEVASRVGLSLRTVRYYEEVELIEPSARTPGGFRLYTQDAIARLDLVKQMKPLGFSLDEMRDLLEVRDQLQSGEVTGEERARAVGRLAMYATTAAAQSERLREQLEAAEAFVEGLRSETETYTTPSRRRR